VTKIGLLQLQQLQHFEHFYHFLRRHRRRHFFIATTAINRISVFDGRRIAGN
jgi:hypothetical protein